jgi:hypothetical protein
MLQRTPVDIAICKVDTDSDEMKRSDIKAATHAGACKCKKGAKRPCKKRRVCRPEGDMEKGACAGKTARAQARHITERATFNALIGWC